MLAWQGLDGDGEGDEEGPGLLELPAFVASGTERKSCCCDGSVMHNVLCVWVIMALLFWGD